MTSSNKLLMTTVMPASQYAIAKISKIKPNKKSPAVKEVYRPL